MGDLSNAMMLFGALLIFGGAGLLVGAIARVRRRLRADARPTKSRPRPRIGRSALLADTVPLRPVSVAALALPRARSGGPSSGRPVNPSSSARPGHSSSSPRPVDPDRREPRRRPPADHADPYPTRDRPRTDRSGVDRPLSADRLPNAGRPPLADRPRNADRPFDAGRPPGSDWRAVPNRRSAGGRSLPPAPRPDAPRPAAPSIESPTERLRPSTTPTHLPIPSPPPRAPAIPKVVPIKVVSVRTAVGRADVVPPSGPSTANWNGPTAVAPVLIAREDDEAVKSVVEAPVRARNARTPDPSRRPH